MSKISAHHYGCSNARNRGPTVCTNMLTVRRDVIEPLVLDGLQRQLMAPEALSAFIAEFMATAKREYPADMCASIRSRRSAEYALPMIHL
jgi:site-specific DNA recombinase